MSVCHVFFAYFLFVCEYVFLEGRVWYQEQEFPSVALQFQLGTKNLSLVSGRT